MPSSLLTIADFIRYAFTRMNQASVYFGHGSDNSWDESVQLVLQSLSLPWDFDAQLWSCRLTAEERQQLLRNISLRVDERQPLAYITQQAWFCGHAFFVDSRVLVPRSPIAELIEADFAPWLVSPPRRIIDLCTGSGCIGIACALQFESSEVDLVDISPEALEVAAINVENYGLQDRCAVIESDVFSAYEGYTGPLYDLIVTNPPYVDEDDLASMPEEYSKEPALGLAAGSDGLDIIRRILRECGPLLADDGVLIAEVGNSWVALEAAYPDVPFVWIDFERGGHGVFVLPAAEIKNRDW